MKCIAPGTPVTGIIMIISLFYTTAGIIMNMMTKMGRDRVMDTGMPMGIIKNMEMEGTGMIKVTMLRMLANRAKSGNQLGL